MKINKEIEFKCLLTQEQYAALAHDYFQNSPVFMQTNEYFCDNEHRLQAHGYSLRVRHRDNTHELTLKKPAGFAKMEINEMLSQKQYQDFLAHRLTDSRILAELQTIQVCASDLHRQASLSTWRQETPYLEGMLFLDRNDYFDQTDYEVEYEAPDETLGRQRFIELLAQYQIVYRQNCIGKMGRALAAKPLD